MSLSDNQIRTQFNEALDIPCNELLIQETIRQSKNAFLEADATEVLSKTDFLLQQSKYIKKRWWVAQGVLLLLLWLALEYANSGIYIQRCVGITAPLFIVLLLPELWKNKNNDAMEIECTAYYSLRQIYAARMILFALVDLVLLSVFFCGVLFHTKLVVGELIIQFFIPLNVTCCICFRTLYATKRGFETFSLLLTLLWIAVWNQIVLNQALYNAISIPIWWALLAISFFYLGYCIWKGQKNYLKIWEAQPSWN